jgi:hypothetical protein
MGSGLDHRWLRAAHITFWVVTAVGAFVLVRDLRASNAPAHGTRSSAAVKHAKPQPSGKLVASIPLPNGAFDLAAGAGSIWVATNGSANPGAPGSETEVARIDAATNRVTVPLIPTGDFAIDALGASSGGAVLGDQLQWLNAATNTTGGPTLPQDCGQPSVAADTSGDVWFVISDACGLLGKFDTLTGQVANVQSIPPGQPAQIAVGDGQVWLSNNDAQPAMLERLNVATEHLERIRQIAAGNEIAVGDGVVGILNYSAIPPTLTRVSDQNLTVLGKTSLVYEHAPSAGITEGDSRFWLTVSGSQGGEIVAYGARSGQPVGAPIPLGHEETGSKAYAFGSLWVSGRNRVLRIQPNS